MSLDYIQYPATVKALAAEIKRACNDYYAKLIDNNQIKEIIESYAKTVPYLLFSENQINPTVAIIIGKKRLRLVTDLVAARIPTAKKAPEEQQLSLSFSQSGEYQGLSM